DFFRKSKIKKMKQRGLIREERHSHRLYLRMTVNERIQHATMAISFIILVITGFMLSYPNAWWARHIRELSSDAFEYRSLIHRISAVVMVAICLYHIYYVSFTTRGRQLIKDLLPRYQDIKDAIDVAKFNLGISKLKPKLDRFSYVEKAEYWALIWGTIVMTATGIIMWFNNYFMGIITIVVWHFYFVLFNPDVYPMSLAWWKGTLTEEEMAEEHAFELERIKKAEEEQLNKESEEAGEKS
ncbi:MAG: cytochrome b/b6 domain-containing protein, partial [Ignavibacteriaceae bacterium]|nr:cytochrome b/b6 domain-containing protein [Ignavibacteriaceae bacterium]